MKWVNILNITHEGYLRTYWEARQKKTGWLLNIFFPKFISLPCTMYYAAPDEYLWRKRRFSKEWPWQQFGKHDKKQEWVEKGKSNRLTSNKGQEIIDPNLHNFGKMG